MNQVNVENKKRAVLNRRPMSRTKSNGEKKDRYVAAKVPERVKNRLSELMEQEDRTESYILNVLIEHSLEAIDSGANLFERKKVEAADMERRTVAKKNATPKRNAK
jgi:predicted DNA-binding protein